MLNMDRRMLSDTQGSRIADLLPDKPMDKGGRAVTYIGVEEASPLALRQSFP